MSSQSKIDEIVEQIKPMIEALEEFDMSHNLRLLEAYLHLKDVVAALGEVKVEE